MSRNGSGVYSLPPGSTVTNGDTSDASDVNTPLADLEADMNIPRPIVAGGTGASSASAALVNLGLTATAAEINVLDGITSTVAELNILDGVTASAAELNILDGVTSTTAELNILDGVTATAAEINAATNFGLIAQGTLSGAELVIEIASDFEAVQIDFWNFQPTTTGNALSLQVGSGTIGSPTWVATYQTNSQIVTAGVLTGNEATPTSVNISPQAANSGTKNSGTCWVQPFNNASINATGWLARNGINSTSDNQFGLLGFRATGSAVSLSLIRLFVAAGTMAGSYRIVGYRKP